MCARTVTREASTAATINTCMSHSVDLVQISSHTGACELCQMIQGRIYSLSGNDSRYPKYGEGDAYIPRHPNCSHVVMPFVEELNNNNGEGNNYNIPQEEIKITNKNFNNTYTVNRQLVNSKEYHDKFIGIPAGKSVRESLYIKSKEILEHRDGSTDEDLIVLDLRTGKEIVANRKSKDGYKTGLTYEQYMLVKNHNGSIITLHNHPEGGRLSGTDIVSMYKYNVCLSVAAGHDGTIHYIYDLNRKIDIEKIYNEEYNEFRKYYEDNMAKKKATDVLYSLNIFKYIKE